MIKAAVLADDFTGALDTCVQFSSRGIHAVMYTDGQWETPDEKGNCIAVLNIMTRHMSPEAACETVFHTVLKMKKAGVEYIYLKTDSGLRGNIGAYLAGAVQAWGNGVVFAPAYPDAGRIVRNGILYIDGVPVIESVFAKDALNPVRYAHVADIIHEQAQIDVFSDYRPKLYAVCLQDATNNRELLEIANRSIRSGYTLFAGCAAFAFALASFAVSETKPQSPPELSFPIVAVSGSRSPITFRQFKNGAECGFSIYTVQDILCDAPAVDPILKEICRNPDKGLLISIPELLETDFIDPEQIGQRICRNLGRITKEILGNGFHGTFMIVGGDTLSRVVSALQIVRICPVCEIETGVVVSYVSTTEYGSFKMITKSGSLGSEKLFQLILAHAAAPADG